MARRGWSTSNFFRYAGAVATAAPLTIAAWARTSITGTNQRIAGLWNSASTATVNTFQLLVTNSNFIDAFTGDAGSSAALTSTTISANTWFHACAVFASATDRRAFLNGGGKGTNAVSRVPTGINRTSIGVGDGSSAALPFGPAGTGDIAEVAMWSIALSDAEVLALSNGIPPFLIRPDALIGYWPLLGAHSPENNLKSNTSKMTMQGTLTQSAHPRVFRIPHRRPGISLPQTPLTPSLYTDSDSFFAPTAAPGAAPMLPGLYSESDLYYTQLLTPGAIALTPALFSESDLFYSPTALSIYTLSPALFAADDAYFTLIITTGVVDVAPSLYTENDSYYSPTAAPGLVNVTPSLFTESDIYYAPIVIGTIDLAPSLFTDSDIFYDPLVEQNIQSLTAPLYTESDLIYLPTTLSVYVLTPNAFTDTDVFYDPTATYSNLLTPALFAADDIFYSPDIGRGTLDVAPDLYADADTIFSQTTHALYALTPSHFAADDVHYAPTAAPGLVNLAPSLFSDDEVYYTPTVTPGLVDLQPPLIDDDGEIFDSMVAFAYQITPSLYTESDSFYSPTETNVAHILPPLFTDAEVYYTPSIPHIYIRRRTSEAVFY